MKKTATLLLSASILFSSYAFAEDKVLATYKGGQVTESKIMTQFKEALAGQPQFKNKKYSDLDPQMKDALLNGYINSMLLEEEAKNSNVENTKSFKDKMADVKKQLIQQELLDSYIKKNLTDKMINTEYATVSAALKGKEEVKVSHILVKEEAKAKEAKKKLNKGAKFADIATEYSTDQSTKGNGGTLGYIMEGQLVPEFEKKAFSMKSGEISDPVKTDFGWHIIKLEDKRKVKVPSKEEAKDSIKNKLTQDLVAKYFNNLRKKAEVVIK